MIATPRRTRLIAGAFVMIATTWTIDLFTGEEPAKQANASELLAGKSPARLVDAPDRARLEQFLFERPTSSSTIFTSDIRNPFAPDDAFEQLAAAAGPTTRPGGAGAQLPLEAPKTAFEDRHRLEGVVTGRRTIALIDGRPYARGATIDNWKLVEIGRDFVIFEGADGHVRLEVPPPGVRVKGDK